MEQYKGDLRSYEDLFNSFESLSDDDIKDAELPIDFASTIVTARFMNNLTQKELATRCNVKQPYIARVEKGDADIQVKTLSKILRVLGFKLSIVPINSN